MTFCVCVKVKHEKKIKKLLTSSSDVDGNRQIRLGFSGLPVGNDYTSSSSDDDGKRLILFFGTFDIWNKQTQ